MTYRVVAPLVLVVDQVGQTHHVYAGGVIDWMSDRQRKRFVGEGLVVQTSAPAPAPAVAGEDGTKPHAAATKAELIAWLVEYADKPDGNSYTAGALQPQNKDELWQLIDAVE